MVSNFELVSSMNTAFGNPKGDPTNINWLRVTKQCLNIPDEVGELFIAMGADPNQVLHAVAALKKCMDHVVGDVSLEGVRDALSDIQVFSYGAQHLMGVNADRDMLSVIEGVMTRFVKNDADLAATRALHAAKGVTETYTEGEYPRMILKSAVDQPDAPKGKFLKSASYRQTQFYKIGE